MNLYKSKTYEEDLFRIAQNLVDIDKLRNKSILITGATGLICSAVVDVLLILDKIYSLGIKVYAACRSIEKCTLRFGEKLDGNKLIFFQYDATKTINLDFNLDYIIHGAGNAAPVLLGKEPVETFSANIFGTEQILKECIKNKTRFLFVSSSEVYGIIQHQVLPIVENQFGYIDILNSRNTYAEAKRAAEVLCSAYKSEYGLDFVIVRPGHIYGPTANINDNRVSSQFMYEAADSKNLVLKSKGVQVRSYCYCLDCASAIISVLIQGENGQAYNISNKESIISIYEMASIMAKISNTKVIFDLPTNTEKQNFNPMPNSSLNSTKLEALGWNAIFSKEEGFEHSIKIIKESKSI